jgi:hypothetical protein
LSFALNKTIFNVIYKAFFKQCPVTLGKLIHFLS